MSLNIFLQHTNRCKSSLSECTKFHINIKNSEGDIEGVCPLGFCKEMAQKQREVKKKGKQMDRESDERKESGITERRSGIVFAI